MNQNNIVGEVKLKQYKRQVNSNNVKKVKLDHHSLFHSYLKQLKEKYGQEAVNRFIYPLFYD